MNSTPPPGAPQNRRLICLVGFMGSGKTTVGSLLARQLAWRFLDLDTRIEENAGLRINEIFERLGEPVFREMENELLVQALMQAANDPTPSILALGGGTFVQPANVGVLRANGCTVIWLDCPFEVLLARCVTMTSRPLFRDEQGFRHLYEQRLPFYRQAPYRVEAGGAPRRVVEQILALGIVQQATGGNKPAAQIIQP